MSELSLSTSGISSFPELTSTQDETAPVSSESGTLKISIVSAMDQSPIAGASISVSDTGEPQNVLATLTTDSSGQTESITLPAPPVAWSLDPDTLE